MSIFRKRDRRRFHVTDEPMFIEPSLMGKPLASPWRRGGAILVDLALLFVIFILFLGVAMHLQTGGVIQNVWHAVTAGDSEARTRHVNEVMTALFRLIDERNPEALPEPLRNALARNDREAIARFLEEHDLNISVELVSKGKTTLDMERDMLILRNDVIVGKMSPLISQFAFFIAYFTLFTWGLNGRTPGKLLFRIRVIRLDGKRLKLWNAFERAGGYSASLSTLSLGFLEAFWHPNRQTVHDRISGTVVVIR